MGNTERNHVIVKWHSSGANMQDPDSHSTNMATTGVKVSPAGALKTVNCQTETDI